MKVIYAAHKFVPAGSALTEHCTIEIDGRSWFIWRALLGSLIRGKPFHVTFVTTHGRKE